MIDKVLSMKGIEMMVSILQLSLLFISILMGGVFLGLIRSSSSGGVNLPAYQYRHRERMVSSYLSLRR